MITKRILVTGGAGFLGSHLCQSLLAEGQSVICMDNFFTGTPLNVQGLVSNPAYAGRFEILRHDVTEPFTLEVDEVYHLACPASPIHYQRNPVRTIRTAVQGTLNVLDMCRESNAKLMIASTSEVYGDPMEHPQKETYWGNVNPIGPRACYDEGKRCAEALTTSYATQYNLKVKIARIFNTYGPRMQENDGRVVSNFIIQALKNQDITLFGQGTQTRSFCYVSDLISGFLKLMGTNYFSTQFDTPVNLGNPKEVSMLSLAMLIKKMTNSKSEIVYEKLPGDDPKRRCPNITEATERLKWSPFIGLEEGLQYTIDYFRNKIVPKGWGLSDGV